MTQLDDTTARTPAVHRDAWLDMERTEKVPEVVARRILRQIVQGEMPVGSRLPPEAAMLAQFGVGRASLREALRILETHGLVRIKPGPRGGPVVTELNPSDYGQTTTAYLHRMGATINELIEARLVIEPVMARRAAQRLTPESAARLTLARDRGWEALDASTDVWSVASESFHDAINGGSGNHVLDLFASALVSIERQHLGPLYTERGDRERACKVHDHIAEAILAGDADAAEDRTREHIRALARAWRDTFAHQMSGVIQWM